MEKFTIFIIVLMVITMIVVIAGFVMLAFKDKINPKYTNKLMVARVVIQACIIFLVMLVSLFLKK